MALSAAPRLTGLAAPGGQGGERGPSSSGRLIYAVGDVHGCYALLRQLLGHIVEDCRRRADGRRPVLLFCGDYVDRGPNSARVVEALIWLRANTRFEVRLLKGNHEQAFLDFMEQPDRCRPWREHGGAETLRSYGVGETPDEALAAGSAERSRDELLMRMPSSHLRLLQQLELMVVIGDFAFVHAGVDPRKPLDRQDEETLLWVTDRFLDYDGPLPKLIVHGHAWTCDQPEIRRRRICIDTGAYATGVLTALRIDGPSMGFIQARA